MSDLFVERYRVIRQLGTGGMGVVFEAEDQLLNKHVAIKTMKKGVLGAEHIMRFQREATALAALNHPHLVPLYVFGITEDNEPYMVMSMETGVPLSDLIKERRILLKQAVSIFIQICDAMQHAHDRSVLHRDLKPGNILVRNVDTDSPFVVIIDFGIAMVETANSMDSLTKTGVLMGTPAYMSPEQVKGQAVDATSDVYSLGCIMFETLTGVAPFTAPSALEVLRRKSTSEAPTINQVGAATEFSQNLEAIVAKCLALAKTERYQSMAEISNDLELFQLGAAPKRREQKTANDSRKEHLIIPIFSSAAIILILGIVLSSILWEPAETKTDKAQRTAVATAKTMTSSPNALDYEEDEKPIYDAKESALVMPARTNDALAAKWLKEYHARGTKIRTVKFHLCIDFTGKAFDECREIPIYGVVLKATGLTTDGLRALSTLPSLKSLTLGNPKLNSTVSKKGLQYLINAPKLRELCVSRCDIDDDKLAVICKIRNLFRLDLAGNKKIDDHSLEVIADNSKKLEVLNIDDTSVTGHGLAHLNRIKKLGYLSVIRLNVNENDLLALKHPEMINIDVTGTKVSANGAERLRKRFNAKVRTDTGESSHLATELFGGTMP